MVVRRPEPEEDELGLGVVGERIHMARGLRRLHIDMARGHSRLLPPGHFMIAVTILAAINVMLFIADRMTSCLPLGF